MTSNVGVVEIKSCNNAEFGVIERWSAEHSIVGANIGANPIPGEIIRIGIDSILQCLKTNVGLSEPLIGKGYDEVEFILEIIRKVAIFRWQGQELAPSYKGSFGIG